VTRLELTEHLTAKGWTCGDVPQLSCVEEWYDPRSPVRSAVVLPSAVCTELDRYRLARAVERLTAAGVLG
jgi:hypothetical protein